MEQWEIEKTDHTPRVLLDSSNSRLSIEGRSYPEKGLDFYEPIMQRSESLTKTDKPLTSLNFRLEYYNSVTMKAISELIGHLKEVEKGGHKVSVIWEYEEDDDGIADDVDMLRNAFNIEIEERFTTF